MSIPFLGPRKSEVVGVGRAVYNPRSCARSIDAGGAPLGIKPVRRIPAGRPPQRHVRHSLAPAKGPIRSTTTQTALSRDTSTACEIA